MPKHKKNGRRRPASEIVRLSLSEDITAAPGRNATVMERASDETRTSPFSTLRNRLWFAGAGALLLLLGLGVMASNGWLPRTDVTGKKTGWFGRELPKNASSSWNPMAPPLPTGT